jgi:hypothetical protein
MDELWLKYRPTKFGEVVGQQKACDLLYELLGKNKLPHSLLMIISLLRPPYPAGSLTILRQRCAEAGCWLQSQ